MKKQIAITAVLLTGCTSVQTVVKGDLLVSPDDESSPPTTYRMEVVQSHDMTGWAIGCVVTGLFYGGSCWGYLAAPFAEHKNAAVSTARDEAKRIGRCTDLLQPTVDRFGWSYAPTEVTVKSEQGQFLTPGEIRKLCTSAKTNHGAENSDRPPS